jgi:hypothetical protein
MQPNAGREARLEAVACTRLFGWGHLVGLRVASPLHTPTSTPRYASSGPFSLPRHAPAHAYLITSSARIRRCGGMVSPSA